MREIIKMILESIDSIELKLKDPKLSEEERRRLELKLDNAYRALQI